MTAARDEGLGRELGVLEGAGLISLAASLPELEYIFRHALIQDAAYESLLRQERRQLHLDVAETLLALYPDRRDELAPVLARHFERAEDHEQALEYLSLAARLATSRYARAEAIDLAGRALALLPDGEDISADERRLRAELRYVQAEAGAESVPWEEGLALLEGVIADAEALHEPALSARAYLLQARGRAMAGEQHMTSPKLAAALEQATRLAEASGSPELMATAILARAQAHYASSDFGEAAELYERAVPALVDAGRIYHASIAAGQLGTAYGHLGQFERAVRWTDRSYELGLESGDPNASLDADLARAIVEGIRGESTVAIDYATKAAEVAERVDNKACAMVAHGVIGEQHLREGDAEQAAIAFEASADLATYCQFMPVKIEQTQVMLQTARARTGVGQFEFERYERALELARQIGDRLAEAELHEQRARDRIAAGQAEAVGDDLAQAIGLFEELGASADIERIRKLQGSL